jgi:hypothetical protein
MLVGAVGEPNSGGIGRRLHIVHVFRHQFHYLVRGLGRFSKGVWTAGLHKRCIGCSRPFFHWALRRKRRGGAGAIAAGPAAWSFSPTGRADVQAARRKVPQTFRPEPTNRQIGAVQAPKLEIGFLLGFLRSQDRKSPSLEKRPFTGSSQPVSEGSFRGAFAAARSYGRAGRRIDGEAGKCR